MPISIDSASKNKHYYLKLFPKKFYNCKLFPLCVFSRFCFSPLTLLLIGTHCAGPNTDVPSKRNISETVRLNIVLIQRFLKSIQ